MKRNLLSSAIIVAIMVLSVSPGCDDKKPKQKRSCLPIVNLPHQLLKRNLLKLPLQKQKLNLKRLLNRWSDEQAVFDEKWMFISSAANKLQILVQRSLARYLTTGKILNRGLPVREYCLWHSRH